MSDYYLAYLKHIRDECKYLQAEVKGKYAYEAFFEDDTIKRASVRSIEIIGEAAKKIPVDIKLQWNNVDWRAITGMRDRLIHDYMGINYQIVWDVIQNKIPELQVNIEKIHHPSFIIHHSSSMPEP